jgi:TPR repeat protein
VVQNDVEAVRWFRAAAAQEEADAQCNLDWMYKQGRGVDQDYVEAKRWCTLAAQQGHNIAQYNLRGMHYNG